MTSVALKRKPSTDADQDGQLLAKQALDISRVLNALGNQNRLLIVCYLMMNDEMKVGDLVEAVKLSQSAISQHLTRLRSEGLVRFRRESQTLFYRIADPRAREIIKLMKLCSEDG